MMKKLTVSNQALKTRQRKAKEEVPAPDKPTRDNTFSQSRDTREDRETRQVKTAHKFPTSQPKK